ncbi:MAG: TonB-dependent siderophore receptor [Opitutaceae bacterium]
MNALPRSLRLPLALATLPAALLTLTHGQSVPPPAATGRAATEAAVQLQPFEVVADPGDTYQALNTTSVSGTNRSLEKLPITGEIFNATMMQDLGTSDIVELLTNRMTGIGAGENSGGSSAANGALAGDRFNMQTFSVRGLAAFPRRNGFMYLGNLAEGFAYERLEVIRGPQSLLYGNNPAGGVINVTTKKAQFGGNFVSAEYKTDEFGSARYQLDANYATKLGPRRVAVRLAALKSDQNFWREVIGRKTTGIFVEAAAEIFPASDTVLRFEVEDRFDTSIQANRRVLVSGAPALVPNNTPLALLLARNDPALGQIAGGMLNWQNVDVLDGNSFARRRWEQFQNLTLSTRVASWLRAQVVGTARSAFNDNTTAQGLTALQAPLTGGNPLDAWALAYRPGGSEVRATEWGLRATLNADFRVTRHTQNQLIVGAERVDYPHYRQNMSYSYYEVDAAGAFLVNRTQLNTANGGRTLMPNQWVDVRSNLGGFVDPRRPRSYTFNGRTYVWDYQKYPNPAFVTPDNPLGFNGGSSGANQDYGRSASGFAALFTSWFGGKFDTLAGVRHDRLKQVLYNTGLTPEGSGTTGNLGVVWKVTNPVSLYVGVSSTFTPGGLNAQSRYDGGPLANGRGESIEGGLKVNAFEGRLSGSVTAFETKSRNQFITLDGATQQILAPTGINGSYWATIRSPSYEYDALTRGLEITLSGRPLPAWRTMFGYAISQGREGGPVELPFYYNDEFRTNAAGQVLLGDGTPLRVPVNPAVRVATDGKTYAAGVETQILTVNILRNGDAAGNYRAQLARDSGGILNAAALGLSISGVGTGRLGLPISAHQLGFVPPTPTFLARRGGERTIGFPRHSFSGTSMYDFREGRLRGLSLGLNGRVDYDTIRYYYNDVAAGNVRRTLRGRDTAILNLIFRYQLRLTRRLQFTTQVNLNNVFDAQRLEVYPNAATGLPDNAGFRNDPRTWVWTNTVRY